MRLTVQTDYALRMLIYLAVHRGEPCRVTDVAEAYGISRNHLLKVALKLGRLGYLTTARGRSGGIALARAPDQINLGALVRAMEEDFALVDCMRPQDGSCVINPVCGLKHIVGRALQSFLSVFDEHTLADIASNPADIAALLDPGQTSGQAA